MTTTSTPISDMAGSPAATGAGDARAMTVPGLVADPAPLGLAGFGITTLCLSVINAGWLTDKATPMVLALAIAYGGLGQLLAGMWAFRRGNTFAATAFTSYGAFWISYYVLVTQFVPALVKAGPDTVNGAVGLYLFAWGIFTVYMFVASLGGTRGVQVIFALLAITFIVLAFANWQASTGLTKFGGYLGLLTAVAALYVSLADVTNANFKRRVLPT